MNRRNIIGGILSIFTTPFGIVMMPEQATKIGATIRLWSVGVYDIGRDAFVLRWIPVDKAKDLISKKLAYPFHELKRQKWQPTDGPTLYIPRDFVDSSRSWHIVNSFEL